MKIFWERPLSELLNQLKQGLKQKVQSAEPNYLLNVNEEEFIAFLIDRASPEVPVIDFDHPWASDREALVGASNYGQPINKSIQVVTYHIPFSGDEATLYLQPSSKILWNQECEVIDGHITFDVQAHGDAEEVAREAAQIIGNIKKQLEYLAREIEVHNSQLREFALQQVQQRKQALLAQNKLMASLGVPVKKRDVIPATFSIPVTRKKPVLVRPQAPSTAFTPEPVLDEAIYQEALRIIFETGREIERHQSLYMGKNEESLRDFLLMALAPHFQSATGETFNKVGKTDILIRHEGKNVFVAECKIWDGPKAYIEGLNQLLGYLTWRDSKTAFVNFVRNKDFSSTLAELLSTTPTHPCFLRSGSKKSATWSQDEFHIPGDKTRGVHIAILSFHIPEKLVGTE